MAAFLLVLHYLRIPVVIIKLFRLELKEFWGCDRTAFFGIRHKDAQEYENTPFPIFRFRNPYIEVQDGYRASQRGGVILKLSPPVFLSLKRFPF